MALIKSALQVCSDMLSIKTLIGLIALSMSHFAYSKHDLTDPINAISGLWMVGEKHFCIYGCDEQKPEFRINVGRLLQFSGKGADNGEEFCQNVRYELRYIDRDLWLMGNDHLKKTMNITEKRLPSITVHCNGESLWNVFGTWICLIDHETILISHYGYIIEAKRL